MTKSNLQELEILEDVYKNFKWPQKVPEKEQRAVANQLEKDYEYVKRWFYRRQYKDKNKALRSNRQPEPVNIAEPAPQQEQEAPLIPLVQQAQYAEAELFDLDVLPPPQEAVDVGNLAMEELRRLSMGNESLWTKDEMTRNYVLVQSAYDALYSWPAGNYDSSLDNFDCKMNGMDLAKMLTQENWGNVFPNIVAKEDIIHVFAAPSLENPDGSLHLIYREYQLTSATVSNRKVIVLRTCKKIEQAWFIAEFSYESDRVETGYKSDCIRLPSGCMIQPITDGLSRVTWIEHMSAGPNNVPNDYQIGAKVAFSAATVLGYLERVCDRRLIEMSTRLVQNPSFKQKEKLILMRMGNRLCNELFDRVGPNDDPVSTIFSSDDCVTTVYRLSQEHVVGGGVMTFMVSQAPESVLNTLANLEIRHELDPLGGKVLKPFACYPTGEDPRNNVSVSMIDGEDTMVIQEVTVTRVGSVVVSSTLPRETYYRTSLDLETPSKIPEVVSGFVIHPTASGSVVTLVLRKLFEDVAGELWYESVVKFWESFRVALEETVERAKEALEKHRPPSPPVGT